MCKILLPPEIISSDVSPAWTASRPATSHIGTIPSASWTVSCPILTTYRARNRCVSVVDAARCR